MKRLSVALTLVLALGAAVLVAGCGEEEELHVVEGEPLELGDVAYNVQITRFLNPDDPEDKGYLAGQERPEPGMSYLGVFLTIENDGDETVEVPDGFFIRDTTAADATTAGGAGTYEPIPSASPYALQLPGQDETELAGIEPGTVDPLQPTSIPPDGEIPVPDTTAADGVIGGAMLLFLTGENAPENRPLELVVPGEDGETGFVELDI